MQTGEKMKDYYAIPGIKENADAQEIKKPTGSWSRFITRCCQRR